MSAGACRKLYYLLLRTAPIIGLWRLVGEGPVGALIAFSWTPDGIKGEELQYESLEEEVECTPYRSVCPRCLLPAGQGGARHRPPVLVCGSCAASLCMDAGYGYGALTLTGQRSHKPTPCFGVVPSPSPSHRCCSESGLRMPAAHAACALHSTAGSGRRCR